MSSRIRTDVNVLARVFTAILASVALGVLDAASVDQYVLLAETPVPSGASATGAVGLCCPQVPTPELQSQPSMVLQEMVGGLALNRLHDPARRQVRRDAQQQMDMLRPDVPLDDLNVERPADLPNQVPHLRANLPRSTGLRYFVMNTK